MRGSSCVNRRLRFKPRDGRKRLNEKQAANIGSINKMINAMLIVVVVKMASNARAHKGVI